MPSATPQVETPGEPDLKPSPADGGAPYKFVFPTSREGHLRYKSMSVEQAELSLRESFIEQLNKAGAQGYRLVAVNNIPVAITKLDKARYEYSWFTTKSRYIRAYVSDDFEKSYARQSQRGFRVASNNPDGQDCWYEKQFGGEAEQEQQVCDYKDLFILQKEKGVERRTPYELISVLPRWRESRSSAEIAAQISEKMAEGFYPSKILSPWEILLEKTDRSDELPPEKPEVQLVRSNIGIGDDGRVERKVNELARQGYRLALINKGIAIMYRRRGDSTPVSYVWVDAYKKDFEARLAKLQEAGAVYRMIYPTMYGERRRLIFEQPAAPGTRGPEYKLLKLELQEVEDTAAKRVRYDITPATEEAMRTLSGLVKDGFVVRELFASDKLCLLLERSPTSVTLAK